MGMANCLVGTLLLVQSFITLLEIVVALVLIVAAWQLGLILAPMILRGLRSMGTSLDEASDEAMHDEQEE